MKPEEWEAFMARLYTLPQMGATPKQDTTDFWREMDAMQVNPGPRGRDPAEGEIS